LKLPSYSRLWVFLLTVAAAIAVTGCAAFFGPGYTIDKQNIDVHFEAGPPPHISIKADYALTNRGTRPLTLLEIRLPGPRRFRSDSLGVQWDGQELPTEPSADHPRNTLLNLPHTWALSAQHSLRITIDLQTADGAQRSSFASDAFFLPADGWAPELVPPQGAFATGGVPPLKWDLTVHVPKDFVVHTSGDKIKTSKRGDEQTVRATQRIVDIYPFVIAGHYTTKQIGSDRERIYLWTRKEQAPGDLKNVSDALVKTLQNYNAVLGGRSVAEVPVGFLRRRHPVDTRHDLPLWLVECPVIPGCFGPRSGPTAAMLDDDAQEKSAEMVSLDTAMIDPNFEGKKAASAAAPAFAASWLGYGQSPGFYEQDPPLSAFPAFAAAVGNETVNGPVARTETIRRALALVPTHDSKPETDPRIVRAKSFLFFYGLEDRYGNEVFRKAVRHMLDARRNSGFNLDDLIAAFDQETHGNTAEFVRLWMKHPGVPAEFRAKYENTSARENDWNKEINP
jgi:hypothetical protein